MCHTLPHPEYPHVLMHHHDISMSRGISANSHKPSANGLDVGNDYITHVVACNLMER